MSDTNELRAVKLTKAQVHVLAHLRDQTATVQMWGGRPFSGMPKGVRMTTLDALQARGFISNTAHKAFARVYSITPAGRAALLAKENDHA